MKKLIITLALLVAAAPLAAASRAPEGAQLKVTLCHKTTSSTNPYRRITVTTRAALRAHQAHHADIVPATGPCPRTSLTAAAGGTAVTTALLGVVERPEPGDADGTGQATIRLRRNQGQLCYRFVVRDIAAVAAAHIHTGDANAAGPVTVTLRTPNAGGVSTGCANVTRALANQILANRRNYYVNVHNADFPGGALRGQLAPTPGVEFFVVSMAGGNEVPPADQNGRGTAGVRLQSGSGQVCFTLAASGIRLPAAAAHIHRGAAGSNGPVLVTFTPPDGNGTSRGCAASTTEIVSEIMANPAGFYVNVHTSQFPGGAIRGQLR